MFEGKKKAVTFSYDDGVRQDIRLIKLMDKYGIRATFNLNSNLFGVEGDDVRKGTYIRADRLNKEDVRYVYENHEVAAHTLTHPNLNLISDQEIIRQVEQDRQNLQDIIGRQVKGLAYPGGGINYNTHVAQVIKKYTKVEYARTTINTDSFFRQKNLFELKPNVYHTMNKNRLFEMGKQFLESKGEQDLVLYVWGHSFELDIADGWTHLEKFLRMISGHNDIFYGTNSEVLLNGK
ncbi:polysaccharide deacetylase family protein [Clostridium sp. C105KSO13]|uniref:polysaccharide deacetylase family protein n=1 Tax=Clostridium sp. C105KSO13 TaxID=1776045 RepID=UPI0007406EE1|nr:polysaccharide deacetylase family protein [Clostridium sp. C105KSO13]CUX35339.1 Polysaccharide deacetylase [Clostridium sp. C105KSO13]